MAITFVQSKTANSAAASVLTLNVVLNAAPTAGNYVILAASFVSNLALGNILPATGMEWLAFFPVLGASSTSLYVGIAKVSASASATIAFQSGSTGGISLAAYEFSGTDLHIDRTASATNTSTAPASGSVATTAVADELLIGAIAHRVTSGTTISSALLGGSAATDLIQDKSSLASTLDRTVGLFYRIISATGTPASSATLANSGVWVDAILTIRESASGGGLMITNPMRGGVI